MPRWAILLLIIAALGSISPARYQVWEIAPEGLTPAGLPANSVRIPENASADLDGRGGNETLALRSGQLVIYSGDQARWTSPPEWRVAQAMIADLNEDDLPEAVLLVVRPFQPWPVDQWLPAGGRINDFRDSQGFSSHIILIGWKGDEFGELWAGSALADPVTQIAEAKMNGPVLVTLEGRYNDPPSAPARGLKVWRWNGFGFGIVLKLEGPFRTMEIHQDRMHQYLVLKR